MTHDEEARKFWRDVYTAAIRAGKTTSLAEDIANSAYMKYEDLFPPPPVDHGQRH